MTRIEKGDRRPASIPSIYDVERQSDNDDNQTDSRVDREDLLGSNRSHGGRIRSEGESKETNPKTDRGDLL